MIKKVFLTLISLSLIVVGGAYIFKDQLMGALTADMFVAADTDSFDPGLAVGQTFPNINAIYQGQEITSARSFIHDKGMVFIANRSADWWPFCMAQFVQLQKHVQDFEEAGINVVALTYDAPDLQQAFIDSNGISYPFLSDVNAQTIVSLGILNEEYQPGEDGYGIPYPGIFIVNSDMEIVGKMFIEGYKNRIDAQAVLASATALLD